jgi:Kef-type K+ transport system membrane component KefB
MGALSADQVLGFVLLDLTIILVAARVVGTLCTRIGQPRVVGEIIAGILLGPTLLGHAQWPSFFHCSAAGQLPSVGSCLFPGPARDVIGQLGQIGLLLFSFLTAIELDRALLRTRTRGIALLGPGVVLLPIGMAFLVGPLITTPVFMPPGTSAVGFTLFFGVMMGATALPVMARILQERDLECSLLGSTGIAASAVATVGLLLAMAVARPVAHGDGYGVLGALVMAIGYVALMLLVVRPVLARIWPARIGSRADEASQPGRFAAVLVLLLASGLAAHLAGLTVIVGGFLAGFVLPVCGAMKRTLQKRLADLTRIILLPVFLACSGLQTDLTAVPAAAFGGLVLLFAGGTVTKWGGGALLARASGLSWPESNVLGILMNCPGVIVLVVALVGLHAGVITTAMQAGVVLVAVVCTALTDPLLRLFLPRLPVVSRDPPPALQTTDV